MWSGLSADERADVQLFSDVFREMSESLPPSFTSLFHTSPPKQQAYMARKFINSIGEEELRSRRPPETPGLATCMSLSDLDGLPPDEALRRVMGRNVMGDQQAELVSKQKAIEQQLTMLDQQAGRQGAQSWEQHVYVQNSTTDGSSAAASRTKLTSSNTVTFRDLELGKVHVRKVLLGRNIMPAARMTGLHMVMQDTKANLIRVSLYNFNKPVPQGAIMAIKDPYYKATNDGYTSVRVENPLNVTIWTSAEQLQQIDFPWGSYCWSPIPELQSLAPSMANKLAQNTPVAPSAQPQGSLRIQTQAVGPETAESFRQRGRELFKQGDFQSAAQVYQEAADRFPSDTVLLNNLSLCYQRLSDWPQARHFAQRAYEADPQNCKAGYSYIKTLHIECRLGELLLHVDQVLQNPGLTAAVKVQLKAWREEAERKVEAAREGKYSLKDMLQCVHGGKPLVYADYQGPVEIKPIPCKGNGMVTTSHCPAGTLLLCERALATARITEEDMIRHLGLALSMTTKRALTPATRLLASNLIKQAEWDKELRTKLNKLFPGPDYESKKDQSDCDFDTDRILHAAKANCIGGAHNPMDSECSQLFFMMSFVNHSCVPNAVPQQIGEFVLLRAVRDINVGQEVVWDYVCAKHNPDERRETLEKGWGIHCDCQLCTLFSENPGVRDLRVQAQRDLEHSSSPRKVVEYLEKKGGGLLGNWQLALAYQRLANQVAGDGSDTTAVVTANMMRMQAVKVLDECRSPICVAAAGNSLRELQALGKQQLSAQVCGDVMDLSFRYYGDKSLGFDPELLARLVTGRKL